MNSRIPSALSALALGLVLTACTAEPAPAPETPTPTPSASTAAPTASPDPVETEAVNEPVADATCETLIAPSTVEIFDAHGWTFKEREFRIGGEVVEGGLECVWGDYTVASDHVQVFGWAPLDASESAGMQQKLLSAGWTRVDEGGHHYVTEDPSFSIAVDEAGFGMTYEFGDGWVTLADTKQGLVLITHP
ncbi:hypothetical protein ACTU6U_05290 [Microbacterium sp. A196]|uniref:hypothetical protein n=1 Tax=unclassified Microbacterium TaxID=2609290 RepID=UPI003FD26FC9